jgi:hypothetical protein
VIKEGHNEKSIAGNAQELIENRIKFKLYAAEHHLKNLEALEQENEIILRFEGRVKWEIEVECFLSQLVGLRDAILFRINDKMGLKLKKTQVKFTNIKIILNALNKRTLLETIKVFGDKHDWFSVLKELRNQSTHRELTNVRIKPDTSEAKVYIITDSPTELEVIPYLEDSLRKMKDLIEHIKNNEPILVL